MHKIRKNRGLRGKPPTFYRVLIFAFRSSRSDLGDLDLDLVTALIGANDAVDDRLVVNDLR